ncbi:MAG: DinB family protein [Bacteroidota bacterium]
MDTTKWTQALDKTTQAFQEAFGSLSAAQLNLKPDPQSWSIAQNLDHLIVINSTYFPVLDALHAGTYKAPFHAKIGFIPSFMGKMVLKAVDPDRKQKGKTFPIWEPSSSEIEGEILSRFVSHQDELKSQIQAASYLLDQGVIISSPANKNIVYSLPMAFDIIVTHERRHLEQAKEVRVNLKQNV